ncbi:MAG: hypothetical protein NTW67_01155 [Candidatus Woesearchaeota archaeon]|nr:hypothetical protein [Candidatus Woesearchaeota archaeon]
MAMPIKHRFADKEMIKVADWGLRTRDAYNMMYVYLMAHDWVVEEDWAPREEMYFPETFYVQRDNPTMGKEIWIRWRMTKKPPGAGPGPSLITYVMDLDWKLIGLKEIEVPWKGQKIKADKCEFELLARAQIVIDADKKWTAWPFSHIKSVLTKRVMRQKILMHRKNLYNDAYRLRDLIFNYLKLETFMPVKEAGDFYLKRTME